MELTTEQMDRAALPGDLRVLVRQGILIPFQVSENGTLCFRVPHKGTEEFEEFLNCQPVDSATWDNPDCRFYAVREYAPTEHTDPSECQVPVSLSGREPDRPTLPEILAWIDRPADES